MTGPNTTEILHDLCLFEDSKTNRLRSLVSVSSHKDNVTISGNTNGLTGIILSSIESGTNLAVDYKHRINTDSLLDVAFIL